MKVSILVLVANASELTFSIFNKNDGVWVSILVLVANASELWAIAASSG